MSRNCGIEPAVVLAGSAIVVRRAPRYLAELRRRGLAVLLLGPAGMGADPADRAAFADVAHLTGSVGQEGSYLPAAVAAAMGWRDRYAIVGVCAVGETMVEPAGLIADALGLPGPGLRATRAARSKYLQRWYLPEVSPPVRVVPPAARAAVDGAAVGFPAVVKPAGRHSSSGVATIAGPAELADLLAGYPEHETLLVERRVRGPEFSVESLTQHGRTIFSAVTRKETTERDGAAFVELAHTVGPTADAESPLLVAATAGVLERLAVRDAITHAEWRIDGAGRPVLMEIAARPPGDGIGVLYELATGRALEPEVVRIALGEPADYPTPTRHARQVYLEHPVGGRLADVTLDWPGVAPCWVGPAGGWPVPSPGPPDAPPTLRAVLVLAERGARLRPLRSSADRVVTFLIDAPTAAGLDELERRVRAAITIRTEEER